MGNSAYFVGNLGKTVLVTLLQENNAATDILSRSCSCKVAEKLRASIEELELKVKSMEGASAAVNAVNIKLMMEMEEIHKTHQMYERELVDGLRGRGSDGAPGTVLLTRDLILQFKEKMERAAVEVISEKETIPGKTGKVFLERRE